MDITDAGEWTAGGTYIFTPILSLDVKRVSDFTVRCQLNLVCKVKDGNNTWHLGQSIQLKSIIIYGESIEDTKERAEKWVREQFYNISKLLSNHGYFEGVEIGGVGLWDIIKYGVES